LSGMAAPVEKRKAEFTSLYHLRPDTTGHNLVVKVLDSKLVRSRPGGAGGRPGAPPARVAECLVGDESGVMLFTARNDQVDAMKAGSYVTLRNAKVDMFRGSMRLVVDQWGVVEPASGASFTPKTDYKLSLVEYELVSLSAGGGTAIAAAAAAPVPAPATAEA